MITLPSRLSSMWRMDPVGVGPPQTKTASTRVLRRADGELSRLARLTGDIHLNGMNLAHIDAQLKVAVDPLDCLAQMAGKLRERHARDVDCADFREEDLSIPADAQVGAEVYLAPDADAQLILGTDNQVLRGRSVIDGSQRKQAAR